MADQTKIEWSEATWNPITGCSLASPGCTNCYAMKLAGGRLAGHPSRAGLTQPGKAGPVWTGEVRLNEQWLDQPLRWQRPRMIFVCAHGDLFHESVPDDWIDRVFAVMALAPQHTFQVLTKRAGRMRKYFNGMAWGWCVMEAKKALDPSHRPGMGGLLETKGGALPNVWLGVSVEDQARADERIPDLLATPAAVRWVSAEPLLGPVDLGRVYATSENGGTYLHEAPIFGLDWVVVGGESGPGARPMHPDWARSLRDQCAAAGVPFFFKQWGEWAPAPDDCRDFAAHRARGGRDLAYLKPDLFAMELVGKRRAGRQLEGALHDAMPGGAA